MCIVKSYRDPVTKKGKQKAVKGLGFYDELIHVYDDAIAHFTEVVKQMTDEEMTDRPDFDTLLPVLSELKQHYNLQRVIVVTEVIEWNSLGMI